MIKNNHNQSSHTHQTQQTETGGAGEDQATGTSKFIALNVSYLLIRSLAPIVPVIERSDRDLADQIQRAASSVSLNLAEGQRSLKGNRQKHYAIAHGSANEVKAALFVAQAWGWIEPGAEALALLDRLLALMWKLTHASPAAAPRLARG